MLKELVLKEIKLSLLSFRFWSVFLFVIILFVTGSIIFCKKYENEISNYSKKQQNYTKALSITNNGLDGLYTQIIPISMKLSLKSLFALNSDGSYPKTTIIKPIFPRMTEFSGMEIENTNRNYKLNKYINFDFVFIIGIIMSFLSVVLSFDIFSKEKEEGVLKLVLSNSVSRINVIVANYIAILSILIITLLFGLLIYMIVVWILLGQNIIILYPVEILAVIIMSMLYLSIFIWISFMISSLVLKSQTSLAILLLIWTFFTILSPYFGGMITKRFLTIDSMNVFEKKRNELYDKTSPINAPKEYKEFNDVSEITEQGWQKIDAWFKWTEEISSNFSINRYNELFGQAIMGEKINNYLSPFSSFRSGMESISNTGFQYYNKFFHSTLLYRHVILKFIKEQDLKDSKSKHMFYYTNILQSISKEPVDPVIIPKFSMPALDLVESIQKGIIPFLYILFLNIIFCFFSIYTFSKMDVR
jgi:ABC-type transport system involved in multi-copper enzyme maturation permease subunit